MSGDVAVLLVEDSDLDHRLVRAALTDLGWPGTLHWCPSGEDALDFLHGRGPHQGREGPTPRLVLLDLKMPGMDGFDLVARVKQDPALRSIPVVIFTSSRERPDVARSYALGANAYVVKPSEYDALTDVLARIARFWLEANVPPAA